MDQPTFSQTPPTEPGLYWYTLVKGSAVYYCKVWRQDPRITYGGKLVALSSDGKPKPVDKFARWWAGYLPEPVELDG